MKILAVEFSTEQRSVAILDDGLTPISSPSPPWGERAGERWPYLKDEGELKTPSVSLSASGGEGWGEVASSRKPSPVQVLGTATEIAPRSTHAFALIEQALTQAATEREEIECLAVGLGPGSYHGIRSAIALAQGWQLARPVKLLGISSAECLAAEAQAKGWFGAVNVVIDAQRNELYHARYAIAHDHFREISPLTLATPESVRPHLAADELVVGPEATRWFDAGKILFPNAATLGRLASDRTNFIPGEKLEPIYLRETTFVKAPPLRVLLAPPHPHRS